MLNIRVPAADHVEMEVSDLKMCGELFDPSSLNSVSTDGPEPGIDALRACPGSPRVGPTGRFAARACRAHRYPRYRLRPAPCGTTKIPRRSSAAGSPDRPAPLQPIDAHDLRLGHVFVGEPNAFTSHATVFEAAKGHRVEPIVGRVIDHDTPGVDLVGGIESSVKIVGEDTRVEAVFRSCLPAGLPHPVRRTAAG